MASCGFGEGRRSGRRAFASGAAPRCEALEPRLLLDAAVGDVARTITWAGLDWIVKAGTDLGPGPNDFSDSTDSVWVDGAGLHLKIRRQDSTWYCAEVYSAAPTRYGMHRFYVDGRVDLLDPNVVLGLFTYAGANQETDIEFSRWGEVNPGFNSQYVAQPWDTPGNLERFTTSLNGTYSTHYFDWQADSISFKSFHDHSLEPLSGGHLIRQWPYTGPDIPSQADQLRVHINLWLQWGNAPTDGQDVEIVIKDGDFPPPQVNSVVIGDRPGAEARGVRWVDPDGTSAACLLTRGSAEVTFAEWFVPVAADGFIDAGPGQRIAEVALEETGAASTLVFQASGGADGRADVDLISATSPVGRILGKAVALTGQGLRMTGSGHAALLHLYGLLNGADLLMAGAAPRGMEVKLSEVSAGSEMLFPQGPVGNVKIAGPFRGVLSAGVDAGGDGQWFTADDFVSRRVEVRSVKLSRGAAGSPTTGLPHGLLLGPLTGRVVTGLDDGANEGACVDGAGFEACVLPGPAADVQIRRVSGPAGNRNVSGTAPDAAPGFYKVVLYAKTDSWYIQPFVGSELPISPAGNWRATHVKPGNLYAWLVRSDFAPPAVLYSPLAVDGRLVVAGDA